MPADREAVAAAVRGASTRMPQCKPPNYSGLSDATICHYTFGSNPNSEFRNAVC
jgi:hypothetical protein